MTGKIFYPYATYLAVAGQNVFSLETVNFYRYGQSKWLNEKTKQLETKFCHMLNGTMCATYVRKIGLK